MELADVSQPKRQTPLPEDKLLRLNSWAVPGAWALALVVAFLGVFILVTPSISVHSPSARIIAGLVWLAVGLMIAGSARSGLVVHEKGITIQGSIKSRHWPWSEVTHFELRQPIFRGALRVHLVDGTVVSAVGFDGKSAREREVARDWVTELNKRASIC